MFNTPDAQPRTDDDDATAPDAPISNRVRETPVEDSARRSVRRRLSFSLMDPPEGNEDDTILRLKVIDVAMKYGLPVHTERTMTVEVYAPEYQHRRPVFEEALLTGRLAKGTYVYERLLAEGHVTKGGPAMDDPSEFDSRDEYMRHVVDTFRSLTYIKL